jgi:hypothetical protein
VLNSWALGSLKIRDSFSTIIEAPSFSSPSSPMVQRAPVVGVTYETLKGHRGGWGVLQSKSMATFVNPNFLSQEKLLARTTLLGQYGLVLEQ